MHLLSGHCAGAEGERERAGKCKEKPWGLSCARKRLTRKGKVEDIASPCPMGLCPKALILLFGFPMASLPQRVAAPATITTSITHSIYCTTGHGHDPKPSCCPPAAQTLWGLCSRDGWAGGKDHVKEWEAPAGARNIQNANQNGWESSQNIDKVGTTKCFHYWKCLGYFLFLLFLL